MPKKTKKQKLASERRKLQFLEKNQAQPFSVFQAKTEKIDQPVSTQVIREPVIQKETITASAFKKDLTKSLLLSGAILGIVFGIYLQQQFGILSINNLIK